MKFYPLRTATAVALFLSATAAYAQQKPEDGKSASPQAHQNEQRGQRSEAPTTQKKATESKDKAGNGSAQLEPKDKASKGTAQGKEPSSTPKSSEITKGAAPKDSTTGAPSTDQKKNTAASANRVQLSEQQRTTIHQTILKDREVNRLTNVSFAIKVGTRVPADLRLVGLTASVISIVPEYRSYSYFVASDEICIVDPNTYEIVEIINMPGQTAAREERGGLSLSNDERTIILNNVDMSGGSTLGLGSIVEGADVPRAIKVRVFPETIVQKIPKLKGYEFFTAEGRIGIVDPQTSKVQLVIESQH
jgi:hypothetical protein